MRRFCVAEVLQKTSSTELKVGSLSFRRKSAYQIVGNRTYNHFRQHRIRLNVFGMENRDVCK